MDSNKALDVLKRIQALAENPHWTAERRWRIAELAGEGLSALAPSDPPGFKQELSPAKPKPQLDSRLFGRREFSRMEDAAMRGVLDELVQWPCDEMEGKPGGRHYAVDYTVSRSRRCRKAIQRFLLVFPQFKVEGF